ncbi:amino acid adenylation domain-containing protein [Chitinophaga sp. MD30]|uniref:non-ribosomal peptide synthetase n=1 Tax=Chitinophaga sp. MD30 TaxID=2033437 RepID=UPI000BAFBBDE|nr:amino acid adenylation domain-containing protein [Chitinophaga sp. MD30]ASZ12153.1 hypothetical protein CK934_14885 [Chitinophaga sp. MD30]
MENDDVSRADGRSPLHPAQSAVYYDQITDIESPHNNLGGYLVLKGRLDLKIFNDVLGTIPTVFDVFRIQFDLDKEEPGCWLSEEASPLTLNVLDLSHTADPRHTALEWMQEHFDRAFDLSKQPLFEQTLLIIAEEEYWWYNRYHHLLTDGYGFSICAKYIADTYTTLVRQQETLTTAEYPSYFAEIIQANQYLASDTYKKDEAYWKEQFTQLPERLIQRRYTFQQNEIQQTGTFTAVIPAEKRKEWEVIEKETNTSLQQLTLAAMIIYFANITGQEELVFGLPVYNRRKQQWQVMGMFTGTIPFKGYFKKEQQVADLLREIKRQQLSDYRRQAYPVSHLNRHLKLLKYGQRQLFDVIVNYSLLDFELGFEGLSCYTYELMSRFESSPLHFYWRDHGKQQPLQIRVDFQYEYFTKEEIQLFVDRILFIFDQFVQDIYQPVGDIRLIPSGELQLLSDNSKGSSVRYEQGTVLDLFSAQVLLMPDAPAVVYEEQMLSYRELDARSNQLAHYLRQQGVDRDVLVPLCITRSPEMLIGILGILKAGGAYVPLDPAYPQERLRYMLEDTGASLVLSSRGVSQSLPAECRLLLLDEAAWLEGISADAVDHMVSPKDLAYVIYTSGSTGHPKGVMNEHGGLLNRLRWAQDTYRLDSTDAVLQKTSFSFDVSVWELLWPLLYGAKVVFASADRHKDSGYLRALIGRAGISLLHFVPSMLEVFLQDLEEGDCSGVRDILCSGEALKASQVSLFKTRLPHVRLHNLYGPTEAAIDVTYWEVPSDWNGSIVPIGRAVSNTNIYITDSTQRLLPVGVPGELCIGGVQVARGYLKRAALSAEKFLPDPYVEGGRLYRTGDLCRWLPDGTIEYLGRIDDQVKIRGYRIELGEIEHALYESGQVSQCVVLARALAQGHSQLVCYLVPAASYDKEALLSWLRSKLPEYMVPGVIQELSSLPLTPNGKVDRKQLLSLSLVEGTGNAYVAPATELETVLSGIWSALLGVSQVGTGDNFLSWEVIQSSRSRWLAAYAV